MVGECLGQYREGLTSKTHLAVDGVGLLISILVTEGQAGDNPQLVSLFEQISVRREGPGAATHQSGCDAGGQGLLAPDDANGDEGEEGSVHVLGAL